MQFKAQTAKFAPTT